MHDGGERVARLAVDVEVQAHEVVAAVPDQVVLHARVPLGARLELVEKVGHHLGEEGGGDCVKMGVKAV